MIQNEEAQLPALPSWLAELLPEPTTPQVLNIDPATGQFALTYQGSTQKFDTLIEAHKAAHNADLDLEIADAVYEGFSDKRLGKLGLSYEERDGFYTLVLSRTDKDRRNSLSRGYADFLKIAELYKKSPDDFYLAWNFVDAHPAFWWASDIAKHPWFWHQNGHMSKVSQQVWLEEGEKKGEPGLTLISLETGGHVPHDSEGNLEYKQHYGDWRLEVTALTFEKAVIELARRVAICFNDDGTDAPDADKILESEKPEWVSELEQRINELPDRDSSR